MKRTLAFLTGFLLAVATAVGGASSNMTQVYKGPARPRAEVAVLVLAGNAWRGSAVTPAAINGTWLHGHTINRFFEMLPGHYELLTEYSTPRERGEHLQKVSFDAEAGKEYVLRDKFNGKGDIWKAEIVEQAPSVDPQMNRVQACWLTLLRGTLAELDERQERIAIKDDNTNQVRVFATGGRRDHFQIYDTKGHSAQVHDRLLRALEPGRQISLEFADCKPDRALSVILFDWICPFS